MTVRLKAMGQNKYRNGFELTLHEYELNRPLTWRKPQLIFVNSMSDLFHADVPESFIVKVFNTMSQASWHHFQVLTKRSERLAEISSNIIWPENVWQGVSVENEKYTYRIDDLRKTGAKIKFLSIEPMIGPISNLNLNGIDWVIVGGESGPGARPIDPKWVKDIRDQCLEQNVPFFFKQWGGVQKSKTGRELDGVIWEQMPKGINIKQAS
jgi:protein gp37